MRPLSRRPVRGATMSRWKPSASFFEGFEGCSWWPTSEATRRLARCSSSTGAGRPGTPGGRRPRRWPPRDGNRGDRPPRPRRQRVGARTGDYSFTAFWADCVAVADQLGRPPVLVGASLGGMAAMLAEGTSDRTVSSGLVLVDITPKSNAEGIQRIERSCSRDWTGSAASRPRARRSPPTRPSEQAGEPHGAQEGATPA